MLRARAGWGFAAAGSPPRGDADDAPLDVVGATGSLAGRPPAARREGHELTLAGNARFVSPEASTPSARETTRSALVSEPSTASSSVSPPGCEHARSILSARARRELERDLRRVHARINESAQAKGASDKMRAYVASKKTRAVRVAAERGALVAPNARRVDDDPDAIRRAAARALAAGVRRATPATSAELARARGDRERAARGDAIEGDGLENEGNTDGPRRRAPAARRRVGQRPPAPPSLTFVRGGFGGRPPIGPRLAVSRTETANEGANDDDEDATRTTTRTRRAEKKIGAPKDALADITNATFSFARFVPSRTLVSNGGVRIENNEGEKSWEKTKTGSFVTDRSGPCLEVRGAFARVSRRARRADGARARNASSTSAAPATFRSAANETGLPTLAGGLGWGSFAFAEPEAIVCHSHSRSVPSFDDDSHRSRDEKNDEGDGSGRDGRGARDSEGDFTEGVFTGEDEDRIEDVSAEYDFPSPAPSAAAAFIGLSRTSPASAYSAYSAYSENGSAPPTPPQFALKGGFSELERALVSGATVAFCGGGDVRSQSDAGDAGDTGDARGGLWTRKIGARLETRRSSSPTLTFGAAFFGARGSSEADPRGSARGSDSEEDSAEDSAEDSFDGFEGLCTPGLPDFAPTRVPSLETPPASASAAPSPRSAAIRAETEEGMATRIQAAFRGMRARRRRNALTSPLSTNTAS